MSNKSGVSSQVISLPKGGGALQGLGETFRPEPFTGTGNFAVPIALPAGRNGLQPQLSLVYSTGNGNGPFGLGWALNVPAVTRKTSKGVPRYLDLFPDVDDHDTFVLSGVEDLVQVGARESGVARFRPRSEGLFARIDHVRSSGENGWKVASRDGLQSLYGAVSGDGARAVVADPAAPAKIFSWHLTETRDPHGNRIEYAYRRDSPEGLRRWDQLYLERVRYVDFGDEGDRRFLVSVTLVYEDKRPDPFSHYRAGFEIRTRLRCRHIDVRTHAGTDRLVRRYTLSYEDDLLSPDLRAGNAVSLLSRIDLVGHDGEATEQMPPLTFRYTRFETGDRPFESLGGAAGAVLPATSLADAALETVDLFGRGLPDIVQLNGTVAFWRNRGNGLFDGPHSMDEAPVGVALEDPAVQFADMNGDGRVDLLALKHQGYFPMRFEGEFRDAAFVPYDPVPTFDLGSGDTRLIDLNGDGVIDALRTATDFQLFLNDAETGWAAVPETRPRRPIDEFPNVTFTDPRVKLGDMSGDGLQDIILVENGNVQYWPYLGHGRWSRRIVMANSPVIVDPSAPPGFGFDPRRLIVGDIDGDGLDDLLYVDVVEDRLLIWLNQAGNRWSDAFVIDGIPAFTNADAVRLADVGGAGTVGVLWSAPRTSDTATDNYRFLDLTGGVKPYLLAEMDNGMGATTRVRYASSTKFFLADQESGREWRTHLPFPVQVVEQVEVVDEFSGGRLSTEYRYHHGYWDGFEREFRGFGSVEQIDAERFDGPAGSRSHEFAPPTLTKTWFHLGAIDDAGAVHPELDLADEYFEDDPSLLARPAEMMAMLAELPRRDRADALRALRGQALRTEVYALDGEGRPFTVTEALVGLREEAADPAVAHHRIFFAHGLAERTTNWEQGTDPMTRFSFTGTYDEFGQPGTTTQIACPRGWRRLEDTPAERFLATHIRTEFARPRDAANAFIVDRVARSTSFEIVAGPQQTVLIVKAAAEAGSALRVIGQTLNFFDGTAFVGLPHGQVGAHGALVRTEGLTMTESLLREAYESDESSREPAIPPYLETTGPPLWTAEYPDEFRTHVANLPHLAGFTFHGGDDTHERGYFVTPTRNAFDFQFATEARPRGLLRAMLNPLGRTPQPGEVARGDVTIEYDAFDLLPSVVTDSIGLRTRARYEPRVLQPTEVTDPNGNRRRFAYTPLGLLAHIAVLGKEEELVGDEELLPDGSRRDVPSTRFEYDFQAFENSVPGARRPISVRTLRRVHHVADHDVSTSARGETIERVEYSDGFCRLLQARTLAEDDTVGDPISGGGLLSPNQSIEPGDIAVRTRASGAAPNVVVSGARTYDNKGRVVEHFDDYFELEAGFDYRRPSNDRSGSKVVTFHDAVGRVIRVRHADGSEERVVHGVPGSMVEPDPTAPDAFEPTPWEIYSYDRNDLAPVSVEIRSDGSDGDALTDRAPRHHHFTPSSALVDALGRTIRSVERNRGVQGREGGLSAIEEIRTDCEYDIRGNVTRVVDALQRVAATYVHDFADNLLRSDSVDAGLLRIVPNGAGNEMERRSGNGAMILRACDRLQRPVRMWARDDGVSDVTLRERLEYGDGGDAAQPDVVRSAQRVSNRLGALHRHHDEAGLLECRAYDFKGNVVETERRVIRDEAVLAVFPNPGDAAPDWRIPTFRVNWEPVEDQEEILLEDTSYLTTTSYDALDRIKMVTLPRNVDGARRQLRPRYNRYGTLEQLRLDDTTAVEHIAYDAQGRRTLIALGNGIVALSAYEPRTSRSLRVFTARYSGDVGSGFQSRPLDTPEARAANLHQDIAYDYDLVGNVATLRDRTPGSGVNDGTLGRHALNRQFEYDALYRLAAATGRECDRSTPTPFDPAPRCTDLTRARPYTVRYDYDRVGNVTGMSHAAIASGRAGFTRQFAHDAESNRLQQMTSGSESVDYRYDARGNMVRETSSRHFEWDHAARMKAFRNQVLAADAEDDQDLAEPTVHAHYLYSSDGLRTKKLVRKQGGQVEVTTYIGGCLERQRRAGVVNDTLHVMDGATRLATVRIGVPFPDDGGPALMYHLKDHLGGSSAVLDEQGALVNREEYTPYGETSFGSFARKRFRFAGKERDAESGCYYYGHRYYAPWIAKWVSCDPIGLYDGVNLYRFARDNPVCFTDVEGLQAKPTHEDVSGVLTLPDEADLHVFENAEGETVFDFTGELEANTIQPAAGDLLGTGGLEDGPSSDVGAVRAGGVTAADGQPSDDTSDLRPDSQEDTTAWDFVVALAAMANDPGALAESNAQGESGGIPGAHGSHTSTVGQGLFVALTALRLGLGRLIGRVVEKVSATAKGALGAVTNKAQQAFEWTRGKLGLGDLGHEIDVLRRSALGKGNFGLGSATRSEAAKLGRAWVGHGYRVAKNGKILISADGLRQYRPPSFKPKLGRIQANFERRLEPAGAWFSDGHLDIVP